MNNSIPDAQDSVPSGWRKIDADGKFSFYLPPDMRDTGVKGIENFHREYTNGRMYLTFDYEPYGHLAYSNRAIAFGNDFQEIELQVDGKKSFLFVYQSKDRKNRRLYKADLYVGDLPNSEVIMSMSSSSRSPQVVETAKTIFRTIKFPVIQNDDISVCKAAYLSLNNVRAGPKLRRIAWLLRGMNLSNFKATQCRRGRCLKSQKINLG